MKEAEFSRRGCGGNQERERERERDRLLLDSYYPSLEEEGKVRQIKLFGLWCVTNAWTIAAAGSKPIITKRDQTRGGKGTLESIISSNKVLIRSIHVGNYED